MKNTIIRFSIMAVVVLTAAVGINAQWGRQYGADIPFNFEAKGRQYAAGEYKLEALSVSSETAIGLREVQSGHMIALTASARPGTRNWDNPGILTFQKVNGKYVLREVSTATFSLSMKVPKARVREPGEIASTEQIVKIYLN